MMQFLLAVCLLSVQAAAIFPFPDPTILIGSGSHFESSAGFPWNSNPFITESSFSGVSPFIRNENNPCSRLSCGTNAYCTVRGVQAVCACHYGYEGNPYANCRPSECVENSGCPSNKVCNNNKCVNPCTSTSCGVDADCIVKNHAITCQCPQGFTGDPFTLCRRPSECFGNSGCPSDKICEKNKCINPCSTQCAVNAECSVKNHITTCKCPQGSDGDPFTSCDKKNTQPAGTGGTQGSGGTTDYCNPTPCGANSNCRAENGRAVCSCRVGFIGNPIEGCRRECESDSDCSAQRACTAFRCKDPCDSCGTYAECRVQNHRPICSCPANFIGDPLTRCYPECTTHDECSSNKACSNLKCADPCIGACGTGAECRAENHRAICSCPKGFTGNPLKNCRPIDINDLCKPNPCGSNAECKAGKDESGTDRPVCFCPAGFLGDPLVSCRREPCIELADCSANKACCAASRTGIERIYVVQPLDQKKMSQQEYLPFFHPLLYNF